MYNVHSMHNVCGLSRRQLHQRKPILNPISMGHMFSSVTKDFCFSGFPASWRFQSAQAFLWVSSGCSSRVLAWFSSSSSTGLRPSGSFHLPGPFLVVSIHPSALPCCVFRVVVRVCLCLCLSLCFFFAIWTHFEFLGFGHAAELCFTYTGHLEWRAPGSSKLRT